MSYFDEPFGDNPKYPCGVCEKIIAKNHKAIRCSICNYKIHIKCNKTEVKDYKNIKCKEEILPFQSLTDQQFFVTSVKGINKDVENSNLSLFPPTNILSRHK